MPPSKQWLRDALEQLDASLEMRDPGCVLRRARGAYGTWRVKNKSDLVDGSTIDNP